MASSAAFTIKVAAGSHAAGPADASGGDVIECKLSSITDIQPGKIAWDIFGTHGVAAPAITFGGSPLGQTATFTLPAGDSQAYGIRCRVNGGKDVTKRAEDTAKSAVYVLTGSGVRPFFINETFEGDSTYGVVPRLNDAVASNPAIGPGTTGNLARFTSSSTVGDTGVTEDGSGNLGATSLTLGGSGAPAGILKLSNDDTITSEDNAGGGTVVALKVSTADVVQVGGVNATGVQLRVGANPVFDGVATKLQAHQPIELQPAGGTLPSIGHLRAKKDTVILAAADAAGTGNHELIKTDAADGLIVGAASLAGVTVANDVRVTGSLTVDSDNTPATTGTIRIPYQGTLHGKNSSGTDSRLMTVDAGAILQFGDSAISTVQFLPGGNARLTVGSGSVDVNVAVLRIGSTNVPNTGAVRLRNASGEIKWRDAANSADILGIAVDASDNLLLGDSNVTLTNVASPLAVGSASGTVATTGDIRTRNGFEFWARTNAGSNARVMTLSTGDIMGIGGTGVTSMNLDLDAGGVLRLTSSSVLVNVNNLRWQSTASASAITHASTASTTAANMSMTAQSSTATTGATKAGSVIIGGGDATAGSDTVLFEGGDVEVTGGEAANSGGIGASARGGSVYLTAGTGQIGESGGHGSVILRGQNESTVVAVGNDVLGLFGATPVAQPSTTGTTTGFTAGSGTGVNDDSTFTGNIGASAYTFGDVVRALKRIGALAA